MSSQVNIFILVGTALGLGIVHVLTGPDHLSALSTLSVGKRLRTAFLLGIGWGCGHSVGLLLVAIVFFAMDTKLDLSSITFWADIFVGIFMLMLGMWYMMKAFRERMKYLKRKEEIQEKQMLYSDFMHESIGDNSDTDDDKSDKGKEEENIELEEEDQEIIQEIELAIVESKNKTRLFSFHFYTSYETTFKCILNVLQKIMIQY